ncbi:MAG TPA: hypothetical protein VK986_02890 [Tepidisphaeraceae bacterium]|nr:hypothetical protein [Tepidisphaeraceae bacterium]
MTDRLLYRSLWLVVMTLIVATAFGGLVMMYTGAFALITRQVEHGVACVFTGLGLAAVCYLLCKHSEDLMDRRLG